MLKLRSHNIILPKYFRMVKKKGSSLTFSAHGWWGKEKNCKPAEKIRQPESEDGSAGGGQGEECRAVRASKPRRLFVRTEASREVFFSLIEKNFRGRAKEKIVKKTSLLDTRARRAAAGRERTIWFRATTRAARGQSGFCSKKVRISSNRHHKNFIMENLNNQNETLPKLSSVEKIERENNVMIKNREQLSSLIEPPLLSACQELYDKNIRTLSSSANRNNPDVYITIDFDSLSENNKRIAESLGEVKFNVETNTNTMHITLPVTLENNIEEVSLVALDMAHKFNKQPLTWGTHTLGDLRSMYGYSPEDEEMQVENFANGEPDSYYYDPMTKLFYESEELYKKANE